MKEIKCAGFKKVKDVFGNEYYVPNMVADKHLDLAWEIIAWDGKKPIIRVCEIEEKRSEFKEIMKKRVARRVA